MTIFNYRELTFSEHKGDHYHVLTATFLDYNQCIKEITVTWNAIGSRSIWVAQFSGLTTEYTGTLSEVLEKVRQHYLTNRHMPKAG